MIDLAYFWIGPLGRMSPMPIPTVGVTNTVETFANEHTSLVGKRTVDVHGWRRTWSLTEAWLEYDDLSFLEAHYMRVIDDPIRLLDPLRKNRAFAGPAGGFRNAGWSGGIRSFHIPSSAHGVVSEETAFQGPTISYVSEGDMREVSYFSDRYMLWDVTTATDPTPTLYLNGPNTNTRYCDVTVPNEVLTYSIYVMPANGNETTLNIHSVTATGGESELLGSATTSGSGDWERLEVTFDSPGDGYGVRPSLTANTDGSVSIMGAQLEVGEEATGWVMGLGSPEVVISSMTGVSPRYPLVTAELTIREL